MRYAIGWSFVVNESLTTSKNWVVTSIRGRYVLKRVIATKKHYYHGAWHKVHNPMENLYKATHK